MALKNERKTGCCSLDANRGIVNTNYLLSLMRRTAPAKAVTPPPGEFNPTNSFFYEPQNQREQIPGKLSHGLDI